MTYLRPMSPEEYSHVMQRLVREYAEDHIQSGQWTPSTGLSAAQKEVDKLLPEGLSTPHQHLFTIVAEPEGVPAGDLWFCSLMPDEPGRGFIFDLYVDERFRRRGIARGAMIEIERFARKEGLSSVGLHVFGHNQAAIALYQSLGYVPTNLRMAKALSP